jgi:hypothetical protein
VKGNLTLGHNPVRIGKCNIIYNLAERSLAETTMCSIAVTAPPSPHILLTPLRVQPSAATAALAVI